MSQYATSNATKSPQVGGNSSGPSVPPASIGTSGSTPVKRKPTPEKRKKTPESRNKTPNKGNAKNSAIDSQEGLAASDVKERTDAAKRLWQAIDKEASTKPETGKSSSKKVSEPENEDIKRQGDIVRALKAQKAPKSEIDAAVKILLEIKERVKNEASAPNEAKNDTVPADLNQLNDEVKKQGDIVRQLKAQKAPKTEIDAAVKLLLEAKDRVAKAAAGAPAPGTSGSVSQPDPHEVIASNPAVVRDGEIVHVEGKKETQAKPSNEGQSAPGSVFTQLEKRIPVVGLSFVTADEGGLQVESVQQGGAAARAGIQKDDFIVSVNHHPITDPDSYFNALDVKPGSELTFEIRRGTSTNTFQIRAAELGNVKKEIRTLPRPNDKKSNDKKSDKKSNDQKKAGKSEQEQKGYTNEPSSKNGAKTVLKVDASLGCALPLVAAFAGFSASDLQIERDAKQQELVDPRVGSVTETNAILRSLAALKSRDDLLGKSAEEKAFVEEWLSISRKKFSTESSVQAMLPRLERDLLRVVFLVNNRLTLADLAMFASLRPYVANFKDGQKKTFVNTCRWFDFIQHQEQTLAAQIKLIDLHAPEQIYSSILTEHQHEQAAALLSSKKTASDSIATSLPEGTLAPYPEGPRPLFAFGFVPSPDQKGLFVTMVLENQAASKAGLQEGDLITGVDSKPTPDHKAFFSVLKSIAPGQTVEIKYVRGGKTLVSKITTGFGASGVVVEKKVEEKEEYIADKQQASKKHMSKQAGEIKKVETETKKKEEPVLQTSATSSPEDAVAKQANVVRDLKAAKASKEEINAAVALLLKLKQEAGVDTGGKKKK